MSVDPFDGRAEMTSAEYRAWQQQGSPTSLIAPLEPAVPDWHTSEKAFMAKVDAYAKERGWLTYHTWKSANSAPGFPDLVMLRAGHLIFAELKVGTNRPTKDQQRWLDALADVPTFAVEVFLWRPEDWQEIEDVLA